MTTQRKINGLGIIQGLEPEEITSELRSLLIHAEDPACQGAVARMASYMGLTHWAIRDYLDGTIKPSLRLLHAAYLATGGHPSVARLLEPQGFRLVPDLEGAAPQRDAEGEFLDDVLAHADLAKSVRRAMADGRISRAEASGIERCAQEVEREWAETRAALRGLFEETRSGPIRAVND